MDQTVEMIQQDEVATKKILGWANSAFSGSVEPITDLKTAIMRVGVGPMGQITLISKFQTFLTRDLTFYNLSGAEFWNHCLATAIATESIETYTVQEVPNECFIAGLIHDMGKLLIDCYAREFSIPNIPPPQELESKSHTELESDLFQCSHAEIGGMISKHWDMPDSLTETIQQHHSRDMESFHSGVMVHFADHIAKSIGKSGGSESIKSERTQLQQALKITEEEYESIRIRTRNMLSRMQHSA